MRKISIFVATLALVPTVAFASWWQPSTWFKQKAQVIESIPTSIPTTSPIQITPESTPLVVEKIIEKPVEKIVTKTITIDNPELLAKIQSLVSENESLKQRITTLESQLSVYTKRTADQQSLVARKERADKEQAEIDTQREKSKKRLLDEYNAKIAQINLKITQTNYGERDREIGAINPNYGTKLSDYLSIRRDEVKKLELEKAKVTVDYYSTL